MNTYDNEKIHIFGDPDAPCLLIQMADDHDLELMETETAYIKALSGGKKFCLTAVKTVRWNEDLSPWPAPPVFGRESFGKEALPAVSGGRISEWKKIFIGGYSLAGLFALWAGYQTDAFSGIAAASPSIWFPGFTEYMKEHPFFPEKAYLSLGDREEKTKNPVMAQVGTAIRSGYEILREAGKNCVLEWNKGNHFREPDLRTAKAFAWLLNGKPQD